MRSPQPDAQHMSGTLSECAPTISERPNAASTGSPLGSRPAARAGARLRGTLGRPDMKAKYLRYACILIGILLLGAIALLISVAILWGTGGYGVLLFAMIYAVVAVV